MRGSTLEACAHCDGLLRVRVIAVQSARKTLLGAVARVLSSEGVLTAAALSIVGALLSKIFVVGILFYSGIVVAYYFAIVDHIGRGRPALPWPGDNVDDWWTVLGFVARGLVCWMVAMLPIVIWAALARGSFAGNLFPSGERPFAHTALIGISLIYLPAAILSAALSNSTVAAAWPPSWFRVARALGAPYWGLVALFFVTAVVLILVGNLTDLVGRIPLVGSAAVLFIWNLIYFANACLVGAFVSRYAEALDY